MARDPDGDAARPLQPRGLIAGVLFTALLMVVVTFGVDPQAVIDEPDRLILPAAALGAVALLSTALMGSDMEHRTSSLIDPLTGMLNRKALDARVAELAQQALVTEEPIGMVVGDLDCFKRVNDMHGHATGDAVLRDVAARMRRTLRAFDLAYRLGGEEFLVLLPGADLEHAHEVAESLRAAVGDEPVVGLAITMSFGVNASGRRGVRLPRAARRGRRGALRREGGRARLHAHGGGGPPDRVRRVGEADEAREAHCALRGHQRVPGAIGKDEGAGRVGHLVEADLDDVAGVTAVAVADGRAGPCWDVGEVVHVVLRLH